MSNRVKTTLTKIIFLLVLLFTGTSAYAVSMYLDMVLPDANGNIGQFDEATGVVYTGSVVTNQPILRSQGYICGVFHFTELHEGEINLPVQFVGRVFAPNKVLYSIETDSWLENIYFIQDVAEHYWYGYTSSCVKIASAPALALGAWSIEMELIDSKGSSIFKEKVQAEIIPDPATDQNPNYQFDTAIGELISGENPDEVKFVEKDHFFPLNGEDSISLYVGARYYWLKHQKQLKFDWYFDEPLDIGSNAGKTPIPELIHSETHKVEKREGESTTTYEESKDKFWQNTFQSYPLSLFEDAAEGGTSLYGKWHVDVQISIDDGKNWELIKKLPFAVLPNELKDAYESGCFSLKFDPVDTSSGAQTLSHDLLTVQGVIPLTFGIDYNSLLLDKSILGQGWYSDYFSARIQKRVGGIRVYWTPQHSNHFHRNPDGTYVSLDRGCRFDKIAQDEQGLFTVTRRDQRIYKFDAHGRLTHLGNKNGQFLEISYLQNSYISKITEPVSGAYIEYHYAHGGLLDKVTDSLGREVRFGYDARSRLISIIDAAGQETQYTYNIYGQIVTGTNADGIVEFSNTFDKKRRIVTQDDAVEGNQLARLEYKTYSNNKPVTIVTNRDGTQESFYYDRNRNLVLHIDGLKGGTEHTYDKNGKRISTKDTRGHLTFFEYDKRGNPTKITDSNGKSTIMLYDNRSNLLSVTDALGNTTRYEYDDKNNRISTTDAKGNITLYTYNEHSQVETVTHPGGGVERYKYSKGRPFRITDPEGNAETLKYDDAGRLVQRIDAAANTTQYYYDGNDRITSIVDSLNRRISMEYDSRDNIIRRVDAKGNATRYQYDGEGRLLSETNALKQTTSYEYDGEGRLIKTTDANGHSVEMKYDTGGRLIAIQDALGNVRQTKYHPVADLVLEEVDALDQSIVSYTYNALNKPLSVTDALGHTQRTRFDELSRPVRVTDSLGLSTHFEYDEIGNLFSAKDAKQGNPIQRFDSDGNRIELQDAKGNITAFQFDQSGHLLQETIAGGTTRYTYNARDLLETVTNARGLQSHFTYDAAGRLLSMSDPDGTVRYTYDANDNVLTVSDTSGSIKREYDALDRVTKYTDAQNNTLHYVYDTVGNLSRLTYPDGKQVVYGYDAANHLVSVTDWAGRVTKYSYDANGRVSQMQRPNNTLVNYSYDAAGQLKQQKDTHSDGSLIRQYDFVYDASGNIRQEKVQPILEYFSFNWAEMSYGDGNRLASYNGMAVNYDADGNMVNGPLNDAMAVYEFDSRNRLVQAGNSQYSFDAENHRIAVSDSNGETRYTVNPLPALSQTLIRTAADGTQTFYVYGLGLLGEERNGTYHVYHFDLRGSTVALSDANGQVMEQFQYFPYGGLANHDPAEVDTPFLYNGRDGVMSDNNGLYYMQARFYNLNIRRFVNRDVLFGEITDGLSLNRYSYVMGEPISHVDPFGLFRFASNINKNSPGVKVINGMLKNIMANKETFKAHEFFKAYELFTGATMCEVIEAFTLGKGPLIKKMSDRPWYVDYMGVTDDTSGFVNIFDSNTIYIVDSFFDAPAKDYAPLKYDIPSVKETLLKVNIIHELAHSLEAKAPSGFTAVNHFVNSLLGIDKTEGLHPESYLVEWYLNIGRFTSKGKGRGSRSFRDLDILYSGFK